MNEFQSNKIIHVSIRPQGRKKVQSFHKVTPIFNETTETIDYSIRPEISSKTSIYSSNQDSLPSKRSVINLRKKTNLSFTFNTVDISSVKGEK